MTGVSAVDQVIWEFFAMPYLCGLAGIGLTVAVTLFVLFATWNEIVTANVIDKYREAAKPSDIGNLNQPHCGDVAIDSERPAVSSPPQPQLWDEVADPSRRAANRMIA